MQISACEISERASDNKIVLYEATSGDARRRCSNIYFAKRAWRDGKASMQLHILYAECFIRPTDLPDSHTYAHINTKLIRSDEKGSAISDQTRTEKRSAFLSAWYTI